VLSQGLSYNQVQVSPDDSQFLELQRFVVEQVCRFLGVPPSMVYLAISGQNVTYANISQADTQYLKHSLQPLMRDIEAAWSSLIDGPMHVRFNPSTLLRMDDMARHQLHALRLANKTITVNAVKALEDEAPFDDEYDAPGVPDGSADARRLSAVEAVQKVYLGVGTVLTSDEARQLINDAGGALPVPGPEFTADGGEAP
jgi:hypothetical protein